MTHHAVSLKVTPCLRMECKFWLEDDGWNGTSDHPLVRVRAASFEQAKTDIEYALGKHIEQLLHKEMSNTERAA
ncbi:MAG TPA: hypothetical protein VKG87_13285 [Terriglobales bacterium]|nr:hypothetical protein [Terriglobales bacterium]